MVFLFLVMNLKLGSLCTKLYILWRSCTKILWFDYEQIRKYNFFNIEVYNLLTYLLLIFIHIMKLMEFASN